MHALVTTAIRLRFYGHSTAYQTLLRSQWRNASLAARAPAALRWPIYLFRPQCISPRMHRKAYGRNVDHRIAVEWASDCRLCNYPLRHGQN